MCNFSKQSPLCGVCNRLKGLLAQHFRIKHAVRIKVVRISLNYKNGVPSNKINYIENEYRRTRLALRRANRSRSEAEKLVTGRKNTEECFTSIESGKDANKFKCKDCSFVSLFQYSVKRHYERIHINDKRVPSNLDSEFKNDKNGIATAVTVKNEMSEDTEYDQMNDNDVEYLLGVCDTIKSEKSATAAAFPRCDEITENFDPLNDAASDSDADTVIDAGAELVASPINSYHNEQTIPESLDEEECYSVNEHKGYRVVHEENGKRKFHCVKCPYVSPFPSNATRHYDRHHSNLRSLRKSSNPIQKSLHGEECYSVKEQKVYKIVHEKNGKRQFHCVECPFVSSFLSNATRHFGRYHSITGSSRECPTPFRRLSERQLQRNSHDNLLHSGGNKRTEAEQKVYNTVREENGKRKFHCVKCPFVSPFQSNATRHYYTRHSNIPRSRNSSTPSQRFSERTISHEKLLESTKLKSEPLNDAGNDSDAATIIDGGPKIAAAPTNSNHSEQTIHKSSDREECYLVNEHKGYRVVHEENGKRKFHCVVCPYVSACQSNAKKHYDRCHSNGNTRTEAKQKVYEIVLEENGKRKFHCVKCPFVTPFQSNATRHYGSRHSNIRRSRERSTHPRGLSEQCSKINSQENLLESTKLNSEDSAERQNKAENETGERRKVDQSETNLECTLCSFVTECGPSLRRHYRNVHNNQKHDVASDDHDYFIVENGKFKCKECDFVSGWKISLKRHYKRIHIDNIPYVQKRLPNQKQAFGQNGSYGEGTGDIKTGNVDNEYQTVVVGENGRYQCSRCYFTSKIFGAVKRHFEKYHEVGKNELLCDTCGKTFEKMIDLQRHRKKKHWKTKPKKCHLCSKMVTNFSCHLRTHTGEMPYCCEICGKKYRNRCGLKYHLAMHSGLKLYECKLCDFKTHTNPGLKTHIKIRHTDRRDFPCPYCDLRFKLSGPRYTHIRRMHLKQRSHVCHICGFAFADKWALKNHSFSHSDIRRFTCTICEQTFKYRGHARKHCYKNHPEIPRRNWQRYFLGFDKKGADNNTSNTETETNSGATTVGETFQSQHDTTRPSTTLDTPNPASIFTAAVSKIRFKPISNTSMKTNSS